VLDAIKSGNRKARIIGESVFGPFYPRTKAIDWMSRRVDRALQRLRKKGIIVFHSRLGWSLSKRRNVDRRPLP
jgi:hypothetical protein